MWNQVLIIVTLLLNGIKGILIIGKRCWGPRRQGWKKNCEQIGVDVQVVPEGLKLKPPTETVLNLGLNPNLQQEMKMLDLLFQISANGQDGGSKDFDLIEEETSGDEGAWE